MNTVYMDEDGNPTTKGVILQGIWQQELTVADRFKIVNQVGVEGDDLNIAYRQCLARLAERYIFTVKDGVLTYTKKEGA